MALRTLLLYTNATRTMKHFCLRAVRKARPGACFSQTSVVRARESFYFFLVLVVSIAISAGRLAAGPQGQGATGVKETKIPPESMTPEEVELQNCGIPPRPEEALKLLQRGLPETVSPEQLPERPVERTQLAVDAMAIIAKARYTPAVDTLIRIAQGDMPPGVEQLLALDVRATSPQSRDEFRLKAIQLLQYNAANALGLIGDKRALPVVESLFQTEQRIAPKIQYALTLACLGNTSGMDFLVEVIQLQNRRESAAAARVFTTITGEDFGYTDQSPAKKRKQLSRIYAEWWKNHRAEFRVDPKAVLARRLAGGPELPLKPRSTRDLLKLSAQYFDVENKQATIQAREQLAAAGPAINADLLAIINDEMEDLDVRMEAMNWYYEINRKNARDVLKRLRRDANPEIVDKAQMLLEKIDRPSDDGFVFPSQQTR